MSQHVPLSSQAHRELRVQTERKEAFGDKVMIAVTVPNEFRDIQNHYPIVFQHNPQTGQTLPVTLFGFEKDENLFLTEKGWNARHIPLSMAIHPFLIGRPASEGGEPTVHIDLGSPRLSKETGQRLFDEQGMASPYLKQVTTRLGRLHAGYQALPGFIEAIQDHELLEPFSLDVRLADGSSNRMVGFQIINEEKIRALSGEAVAELHAKGWLMPAFMAIASLSNLGKLVDLRNERMMANA